MMDNAKMTKRLQWEVLGLKAEIGVTKSTLIRAAKDLQARAQRAMDETTDLVEGRMASMSWIEFAQSDIEQARKAEEHLRLLQEKLSVVSRFLEFAQQTEVAE